MDVLLVDTAGRLRAKSQLMNELAKIERVVKRLDAQAPHEVILVLDGGVGQNALSQVKLSRKLYPSQVWLCDQVGWYRQGWGAVCAGIPVPRRTAYPGAFYWRRRRDRRFASFRGRSLRVCPAASRRVVTYLQLQHVTQRFDNGSEGLSR